jgi:acyl-CoA thioester hydrolase
VAFRFSVSIPVRFRDLDAIGHVNNAVYLTYLEQARIAYWMKLTGLVEIQKIDIILARVEIDYRSPLAFGETVDVAVRCIALGRSSCTLELRLTEQKTGRLVAESRNVIVQYDYAAGRPAPIPERFRRLIREQDPEVVEQGGGAA